MCSSRAGPSGLPIVSAMGSLPRPELIRNPTMPRGRFNPRLCRVYGHLVAEHSSSRLQLPALDGQGGVGNTRRTEMFRLEVLPGAHGDQAGMVHVPGPLAPYSDALHRTGASGSLRLTDRQRDECVASIAKDSFCILPIKLPDELIARANEYITAFCDDLCAHPTAMRSSGAFKPPVNGPGAAGLSDQHRSFSQTNLVELDPVFREMLTFRPALQLCYDCFGPIFHLGQDKWTRKFAADDYHVGESAQPTGGIGWHSDGPIGFPEIDGRVPFHTLRFGYMLSDTTHQGQNGTLECFRGSHWLKAAYAQPVGVKQNWPVSLNPRNFPGTAGDEGTDPAQYSEDHLVHKAPAGTIVAFQNGMWHRALPNLTDKPRTVVYFQYCPCMIHPLHRDSPYVRLGVHHSCSRVFASAC